MQDRIGWFRDNDGRVITAQVVQEITKDKLLVEDVQDFHRRYTIHTRYFNEQHGQPFQGTA